MLQAHTAVQAWARMCAHATRGVHAMCCVRGGSTAAAVRQRYQLGVANPVGQGGGVVAGRRAQVVEQVVQEVRMRHHGDAGLVAAAGTPSWTTEPPPPKATGAAWQLWRGKRATARARARVWQGGEVRAGHTAT